MFIFHKFDLSIAQLLRSWVPAGIQILISLNLLDRTVVVAVFATVFVVGPGIITGIKIDLTFQHITIISFVIIVNQILILILLILLRIRNNIDRLRLLLVLGVGLVWHDDLVRHVGAILLWDNVLAWVQHNDLLELILVVLKWLWLR